MSKEYFKSKNNRIKAISSSILDDYLGCFLLFILMIFTRLTSYCRSFFCVLANEKRIFFPFYYPESHIVLYRNPRGKLQRHFKSMIVILTGGVPVVVFLKI